MTHDKQEMDRRIRCYREGVCPDCGAPTEKALVRDMMTRDGKDPGDCGDDFFARKCTKCQFWAIGEAVLPAGAGTVRELIAEVARLRNVIERVLVCNDAITVGALRDKLRVALAEKEPKDD